VPYPEPANGVATKIGKANSRTDTKAEVALRSMLHHQGLRFRKDQLIRCSNGLRVRPDVVFTRSLVAVFVDGCFWHGCPDHQRVPLRNREYWVPKLQTNRDRDRRVDETLRRDDWLVERVWEHEDPEQAAERIERIVRLRSGRRQTSRS